MFRIDYDTVRWERRDWLVVGDIRSWDDAVCDVGSTWCIWYLVYAVLSVCCTRCMLCSVYAVLGGNSWSWHGEIERDDWSSCSWVMVELRTREKEIGWDGANHQETLGLKRLSCESEFTLPDTAGKSTNPACNDSNMRCSLPDPASRTPDVSYSLLFSTSFSSPSPISVFLVHNFYHHRRTES